MLRLFFVVRHRVEGVQHRCVDSRSYVAPRYHFDDADVVQDLQRE